MLPFFDYVYYKACEFYRKNEEGEGFSFSGVVVISTAQGLNLFSLLFIGIEIFSSEKVMINKLFAIVFALAVLIVNLIRYNKIHYELLKERWVSEEEQTQKRKQNWVVVYLVFSIVLFFGLAIYLGSKK